MRKKIPFDIVLIYLNQKRYENSLKWKKPFDIEVIYFIYYFI